MEIGTKVFPSYFWAPIIMTKETREWIIYDIWISSGYLSIFWYCCLGLKFEIRRWYHVCKCSSKTEPVKWKQGIVEEVEALWEAELEERGIMLEVFRGKGDLLDTFILFFFNLSPICDVLEKRNIPKSPNSDMISQSAFFFTNLRT